MAIGFGRVLAQVVGGSLRRHLEGTITDIRHGYFVDLYSTTLISFVFAAILPVCGEIKPSAVAGKDEPA